MLQVWSYQRAYSEPRASGWQQACAAPPVSDSGRAYAAPQAEAWVRAGGELLPGAVRERVHDAPPRAEEPAHDALPRAAAPTHGERPHAEERDRGTPQRDSPPRGRPGCWHSG